MFMGVNSNCAHQLRPPLAQRLAARELLVQQLRGPGEEVIGVK
jgi:hypothetical protein